MIRNRFRRWGIRSVPIAILLASATVGIADLPAQSAGNAPPHVVPVSQLEAPGRMQIRALAHAYPDRIAETAFRDGEWALRIEDQWFYWADGRLLPEHQRFNSADFTGIRFYNYTTGPLVFRPVDPQTAERLRQRNRGGSTPAPPRYNGFLDALYGIAVRSDGYQLIVNTRLFGRQTQVHRMIVEPLREVEREVLAIADRNAEVRAFLDELHQVSGFVWRNIAGTASRSYHSYGIAVDLIPRSYQRRFGYWRWALDSGIEEWWDLPLEQRWNVPQPVIDAFERNGFIWGGKWLSFDPIHFEYRPEVLILARWREAGLLEPVTGASAQPRAESSF